MERNMEMSKKYIMQSNKWHAAEQKGVYVVEQLGTIYCGQNINGELTILGQHSTPQSTCQLPPVVRPQQGKKFQAISWDNTPDPTCTNPRVDSDPWHCWETKLFSAPPVALFLSLVLPVFAFFQPFSETSTDLGISQHPFLGSYIHYSLQMQFATSVAVATFGTLRERKYWLLGSAWAVCSVGYS